MKKVKYIHTLPFQSQKSFLNVEKNPDLAYNYLYKEVNMLLEFEFTNWKSFKEENYITSLSSREEQHSDRRAYIPKFDMNVLAAMGIFGGNASGKSNLIDALSFLKNLVVNHPTMESSIPVRKYFLDSDSLQGTAKFYLKMLIDEYIYHFHIELDEKRVLHEKLEFENSSRTILLYERIDDDITLGKKYQGNSTLSVIANGTRANRLFISNTIDQKCEEFRNVYNWFEDLRILTPNSFIRQDELDIGEYIDALNEFLPSLDTGIVEVFPKEIDLNKSRVPKDIVDQVLENIDSEGYSSAIISGSNGDVLILEKKDEYGIKAYELSTKHRTKNGEKEFDLKMESMGTLRSIDLIPLFFELTKKSTVVIIDEIDRSLHTEMTRGLIEYFLNHYTKDSRSQLIFTSHDTNLLTQEIFRRDELWIVERNKYNESNVVSIGDYKDVKTNHNLESLYLQGRLGGIPSINI